MNFNLKTLSPDIIEHYVNLNRKYQMYYKGHPSYSSSTAVFAHDHNMTVDEVVDLISFVASLPESIVSPPPAPIVGMGEYFKTLRNDISRVKLAKRIGMNDKMIEELEKDTTKPTVLHLAHYHEFVEDAFLAKCLRQYLNSTRARLLTPSLVISTGDHNIARDQAIKAQEAKPDFKVPSMDYEASTRFNDRMTLEAPTEYSSPIELKPAPAPFVPTPGGPFDPIKPVSTPTIDEDKLKAVLDSLMSPEALEAVEESRLALSRIKNVDDLI